jgi:multiple antibiotic resistance protein
MIILYSEQEANNLKMLFAIILAWIGVTTILVTAPYLQTLLGKGGLSALEQLMGMILTMIAIEMIVHGASLFLTTLTIT